MIIFAISWFPLMPEQLTQKFHWLSSSNTDCKYPSEYGNQPLFGACYGVQQISKTLGYDVSKAPYKEVGWAPVYLKSNSIQNIPPKLSALHWHEEMFEIPKEAELLFSSDLLENQGFLLKNIIGLQFHFEPTKTDIHEIVVNDASYALNNNALNQSPKDILTNDFPSENKETMFKLLDYISQ